MRRWAWSRVLKFGENWKGGGSISGTAQAGKEHGTWGRLQGELWVETCEWIRL